MDQKQQDIATITALMQRLTEYYLPRAQRILERVNNGEKISDIDIRWLKERHADSLKTHSLVNRNPEYSQLVVGFIDLYTEIISKAIENEKAG